MRKTREITNKILEAIEEGILDRDTVILAALNWLSEHEVAKMADANCFFEHEEEEEDEECVASFARAALGEKE